jgi:hypothetical protein
VDIEVLDSTAFTAALERALASGASKAIVLIEVQGNDAVKVAAEARIVRTVRPHDMVGRLDDGRLAVLTAKEGAAHVAFRLSDRLREPFGVGAHKVSVEPKVRVGYSDGDVKTAEALLLEAERSHTF